MSDPRARTTVGAYAVALLVATIALSGCGRSYRLIHQGDTYFERCYGADFDARIPNEYKLGCWQAWLDHYTFGQPLQRVDYARARVTAISAGLPGPFLPAGATVTVVAPAYAPDVTEAASGPPGLVRQTTGQPDPVRETSGGSATEEPPTPPATPCAAVCRHDWDGCVPACADPTTFDRCQRACDADFRACMRACY